MKKYFLLLFISCIAFAAKAEMDVNSMVEALPQGQFLGTEKNIGSECDVKIFPSYDNNKSILSVKVSEGKEKHPNVPAVSLNNTQTRLFLEIDEDGTKTIRATYAYAECCHSGGRDEAYLEIKENKIVSVRVESYVDLMEYRYYTEQKIYDRTCLVDIPLK